jgi:hypothetical protein
LGLLAAEMTLPLARLECQRPDGTDFNGSRGDPLIFSADLASTAKSSGSGRLPPGQASVVTSSVINTLILRVAAIAAF